MRHVLYSFASIALIAGCLVRSAAAEEVGTVTAVRGSAEIGRGGAWHAATEGEAVHLDDSLRTGADGRIQVLLRDDSVISLTEGSQLVVDVQTYDPDRGTTRTLLRMLGGKVRSLVGDAYGAGGGQYEIETATAVAGVRGTEFIVAHDQTLALTHVIALGGTIEVHSLLDRARNGVMIGAGEVTRVRSGELPTPAAPFDSTFQRQMLDGFDFIGAGAAAGPGLTHSIANGESVPDPDRAPESAGTEDARGRGQRDSSTSLIEQPPNVVEAVGGELNVRF